MLPPHLLYAFDLLEHDGADLRDLPLLERKQRLARLLGRAKRQAIHFSEHLVDDGPTVFKHVCRMGLEGHRVEADGCALSQRTIEDMAQVEDPGERGASLCAQQSRFGERFFEPTPLPLRMAA